MVQQLTVLAVLPEEMGSISNTHMVAGGGYL